MTTTVTALSGAKKAAILTLLLGEEGASGVLKNLREDELEQLAREIATLKGEIEALRTDPVYVERIARDELGMVRDEEFVFQFPAR